MIHKKSVTFKKHMFPVPSPLLPSANEPEVGLWAKSLQIEYENILDVLTDAPFLPTHVS